MLDFARAYAPTVTYHPGQSVTYLPGSYRVLTELRTRPYASSYQVFSGFGSTSFGSVSLSGYDTSGYTAAISNAGMLTFSATAIPEPPTYAALVGALALGFAVWRRRRVRETTHQS